VQTLFSIIILIASVVLIFTVMLQPSKSEGLGTIGGAGESIWGKSKSKNYEDKLAKATTIAAIVFMVSAIVLAAIQ